MPVSSCKDCSVYSGIAVSEWDPPLHSFYPLVSLVTVLALQLSTTQSQSPHNQASLDPIISLAEFQSRAMVM